jgi:hypothetical protein
MERYAERIKLFSPIHALAAAFGGEKPKTGAALASHLLANALTTQQKPNGDT